MSQVQAALGAAPAWPDDLGWRGANVRATLREAFDAGRVSASEFVGNASLLEQADKGAETWADANEQERTNLIHAIYARIKVAGPEFVGVSLTPEAERHGLALTLPEEVTIRSHAALACPRGLEPPTFRSAT